MKDLKSVFPGISVQQESMVTGPPTVVIEFPVVME